MKNRRTFSVLANTALFAAGGFFVALLAEMDVLNIRFSYVALTLLLVFYLWLEVIRIRRAHPYRWMLNPAVICALMTFVMGYGVTNILFFLPRNTIAFLGLVPEVSPSMVKHQYLALLGAIAMFTGYWSPLAARLSNPRAVVKFQHRYLPGTDILWHLAVPLLLVISVGIRLLAMRQGLFGYGGDFSAERLAQTAAYSQYLSMAGGLGKLSLVLAALKYFSPYSVKRNAIWFWTVLLVEIFFGILTGMKSAVGMPIVIVGICQYICTGKIPKKWIALTFASIVMAYAIIQPFREVRNQQGDTLTSVSAIVDVLIQGVSSNVGQTMSHQSSTSSFLLSFSARSNLSYIGSFGIEYADAGDRLPAGSPAFLKDLFLAPLHALIPRFIWDSKPLGNLGLWYNQVVMGMSHFSSTAMGPFTYLYFAGGYLAVGIAFYFLGVFQRCLWFLTTPGRRFAGTVLFLVLLPSVAIVESSVNGMIIQLIRYVIIFFILMRLIFLKPTPYPATGKNFKKITSVSSTN
jgi:hypothetical protein